MAFAQVAPKFCKGLGKNLAMAFAEVTLKFRKGHEKFCDGFRKGHDNFLQKSRKNFAMVFADFALKLRKGLGKIVYVHPSPHSQPAPGTPTILTSRLLTR